MRQCEQEIPLFQPQCSDAQIVRSPFNRLLTDAWTLCNVALGLACSPGVFWVGESLFMFVLLLPPSLILWQRKIGESRNSNQALSRAKTFTRPKKTPAPQATLGQGWKPFSDVTGVECDVLGQQVPRQTLDDHSTVINFLEQLLHGSRVVCDSGFRHSQPNLGDEAWSSTGASCSKGGLHYPLDKSLSSGEGNWYLYYLSAG